MREDFEPLASGVLGVFVFGSHARGGATPRSDIDVCLVGGPGRDPDEVLRLAWSRARLGGAPYDLKVFEELPMFLKAAVLEEGVLVLARDVPSLFEYLVPWRRLWADQAHRNRVTPEVVERIARARG